MNAKLLLLGICWILGNLQCLSAQTIEDPIKDYLTTRNPDRDTMLPNLKELYVVQCDLTNKGKVSTIISFNGFGGHAGNYWTVYLPSGAGFKKADDTDSTLIFHKDAFSVGEFTGKYGLLAYASNRSGGELNFFWIANQKIVMQKLGSLNRSKEQDNQQLEKYFGNIANPQHGTKCVVKTFTLDELRQNGYEPDAAIQAAASVNHPLMPPLSK